MYTSFRNKMASHLDRQGIVTDNEIHLYLISLVAVLFCVLVHIYLLVVFFLYKTTAFTLFNLFSICVYCFLFLLHRRRNYTALALILSADVTLYATFTIITAGISTYIVGYYLLVIVLQLILPYARNRLRAGVIILILLVGLPCIIYSLGHAHPIQFSQTLEKFLIVSNICILFVGTIFQLCIGNIVGHIIQQLNDTRMMKLSVLANTDPLTELFNRRYAEAYFSDSQRITSSYLYCVAMVDIDDFKKVNDTHGHQCGDEVLVFLADFLAQNLRRSDTVFRWGGEEFLLVLENVDMPTATNILDKLRDKLAQTTIPTSEQDIRITITIGLTVLDLDEPIESIKRSDQNLYVGKQGTKNVVVAR